MSIFRTPDIPKILEAEVRKHLPKGYHVQAGREEATAGYAVNVWRLDPEKGVQGLDDVVCRTVIGYDDVLAQRQGYPRRPRHRDVRVVLLNRLREDLERRKGPIVIESEERPSIITINGERRIWIPRPRARWWRNV